ncbi:MAG TPA: hypothetical protein PKD72_15710, partial [Gemmatales bacterium]|nr:hypothetical protein [Gemmatales bacterium]
MRRTSRWIFIAFISLLIGATLGAAVAGVLFFQQGTARYLVTGESSYEAGLACLKKQDANTALIKFHEASLAAENVLQSLESATIDPALPAEQIEREQKQLGLAHWLKYRAQKARAFTKLLVENKPLPTFEGQSTGSPDEVVAKLSPLRLPEEESRRHAVADLREAGYRLPKSVEVLREAVAVEIQMEPLPWNHIHAFASTLHEIDPQDYRALYLLARLEYEQPVAVKADAGQTTVPLPAAKRSRERMQKSLTFLQQLKQVET